jgi:hypothetical protein
MDYVVSNEVGLNRVESVFMEAVSGASKTDDKQKKRQRQNR